MKISSIFYSLILLILLSTNSYSQVSGEPFHPETANGANYIHATGHRLLWENPDSTVYNIIYFSSDSTLVAEMDSTALLYNGSPSTAYDTIYLSPVEPLDWYKKYYWRIVEFYNSSSVTGPVWQFKTMQNPICDYFNFYDDFESGLSNWTVSNDGGTCVWDLSTLARPYSMPPTSFGYVLAADADLCGSGTSTLTTITLNTPLFGSGSAVIIEFDTDWRVNDSNDEAYVELSSDGGQNWQIAWSRIGVSERNSHELINFSISFDSLLVRFRSVQPAWDWWWAIDKLDILNDCPLTQYYPPYNLKLHTNSQPSPKVELNWSRGQFVDLFNILRKSGLPDDSSNYSLISYVDPSITNFTDTTIERNQIYTYKVCMMYSGCSNEATVYIPDVITNVNESQTVPRNFGLSQNYPNPFNPTTKITYQIAQSGIVSLKVYDILGREVAKLLNEEKPAGKYEVKFSAIG